MNIRIVGVNYMRNNPERFIESNTEDSWASYLANMSQQGTWADALVIQAIADAFHMTIQPRSQGSLLPAPWSERDRDPGKRWSRVSQNLGDYKQTIWGRGR